MIKNYLKTAYRNLKKSKSFAAINILGLSVGLATCLIITLYVLDELSYDRFNKSADRIFRVNVDARFGGNVSSNASAQVPLAAVLKSDFPEVEESVRLRQNGDFMVRKGSENIQESKVVFADQSLFSVFTLPMIDGNPSTALKDPYTIVLTVSAAKKYFNRTDVVGQTIVFNDTSNYKITGIIKDIPQQSHFNFDFIASMSTLPESYDNSWLGGGFNTYILLRKGADPKKTEAKFPSMMLKYMGPQLEGFLRLSMADFEKSGNYIRLNLSSLTSIHLYSNRIYELGQNGNIQYVYIFSIIAVFILLIACVNFMNLSTARSANRSREVGVRKVLGSSRKSLIAQFLTESLLITFVSTIIALLLTWAFLPLFNQIAAKELSLTGETLPRLLSLLLILIIVIGFLAGAYPAFFLSSFNPINVLKGKLSFKFKGGGLRSFLVVFQFSISIFLIIGTLVIFKQLNFIQTKNLGFDRDQVLVMKNVSLLNSKAKVLKQEIKQLPGVLDATLTGYLPTAEKRNYKSLFQDAVLDQKRAVLSQFWAVDEGYIGTLGIKMVAGRNFSTQFLTDSSALIINEAAARALAFSNPLNKELYMPFNGVKTYHIIGVIKDFNFNSLRENVTPVILTLDEDRESLSVRIKSDNLPALMSQIEKKWSSLSPNQQFVYSFMDQDFDAIYRSEQRIGKIFLVFTILAILIACLGLFGLSAYATEQRIKEIGIRKVLGANMSMIVGLLAKDFIKLVLIAIIISSPVAWFMMKKWLGDFAYHVNIQWGILVLIAGCTAILIAFITISFQSVKAALTNPIKSLRSE